MSKAIHQEFSPGLVTCTQLYVHKSSPLLSEQTWASAAILGLRVFILVLIQLLPRLHEITGVLSWFYIASFCMLTNSKCLHFAFFSLRKKQHCPWSYTEPANCMFDPECCRALETVTAQLLLGTNLSKFGLILKNSEIRLWWYVSPSRWLLMAFCTTVQVKNKLWAVTLLLESFRVEVFNILISSIWFQTPECS